MEFSKQLNKPLFADLLWSRPQSARAAGQLLILGGNRNQFSAPTLAASAAAAAGIGRARVLLPASLAKLVPTDNDDIELVASTPSGSLAKAALEHVLAVAEDSDALLLAGSFSANSETTVLLEALVEKSNRPVAATSEVIPLLKIRPDLLGRKEDLTVADMPGLFALANAKQIGIGISREPGLIRSTKLVQAVGENIGGHLVVAIDEGLLVWAQAQLSYTPMARPATNFLPLIAGVMAVFWLQNRAKPYQALTSGAYVLAQASRQVAPRETATLARAITAVLNQEESW